MTNLKAKCAFKNNLCFVVKLCTTESKCHSYYLRVVSFFLRQINVDRIGRCVYKKELFTFPTISQQYTSACGWAGLRVFVHTINRKPQSTENSNLVWQTHRRQDCSRSLFKDHSFTCLLKSVEKYRVLLFVCLKHAPDDPLLSNQTDQDFADWFNKWPRGTQNVDVCLCTCA